MTTKTTARRLRDAKIRRLCRETDMTQAEIAQRVGLSQNRISQINRERPAMKDDPDRPPPGEMARCPECGTPRWFRGSKVRD